MKFKKEVNIALNQGNPPLSDRIKAAHAHAEAALKNEDDKGLQRASLEMRSALQSAFLRDEPENFALAIESCTTLAEQAVKMNKSDDLLYYFKLQNRLEADEYSFWIDMLKQPPINKPLFQFLLIEHLELERNASIKPGSAKAIVDFKAKAYEKLTPLPTPLALQQQGKTFLKGNLPIDIIQLTMLGEQFWANLSKAVQQKNAQGFSDAISRVIDLCAEAISENRMEELLQIIDLPLSARDAFLRSLHEKNREVATRIYVDSVLKTYHEKHALASTLESLSFNGSDADAYTIASSSNSLSFRFDVYNSLKITPPELMAGSREYETADYAIYTGYTTWLLSKNFSLDDPLINAYLPWLAKSPYMPEILDHLKAGYPEAHKKFSELLPALALTYQLSHRFGLHGKIKIQGVEIDLEGGHISSLLPEAQKTHWAFQDSSSFKEARQLIAKKTKEQLPTLELSEVNQDQLYQSIREDINSTTLMDTKANIVSKLQGQEIISIPTCLRTKKDRLDHYVNISFSGNLVFIADNSRPDIAGIRIFKADNTTDIPDVITKLQQSHMNDRAQLMFHENFEDYLTEKLKLTEISTPLAYSEQKVGNCGWSSCAKMVVRATTLGRFYQFFIKNKVDPKMAMESAKEAVKIYGKVFSEDDRERFLHEFLTFFQENPTQMTPQILDLLREFHLREQANPMRQPLIKILETALQGKMDAPDMLRVKETVAKYIQDTAKEKVEELKKQGENVSDGSVEKLFDSYKKLYLDKKLSKDFDNSSLSGRLDQTAKEGKERHEILRAFKNQVAAKAPKEKVEIEKQAATPSLGKPSSD